MSYLSDDVVRNWAFAHAYSGGRELAIGLHDGPPWFYEKTSAIYLANGQDNADDLLRLGLTEFVAFRDVDRPHYRYAIIRNGNGIGDVFFAVTAGVRWAIQNQYPPDLLCVMLNQKMISVFKDFVFNIRGLEFKPNFVAIPQVDNDLATRFFDVWIKHVLKDYVIFDCTVEGAFTRTLKDLRFLANEKQNRRTPNNLTYFGENLRVAGVELEGNLRNCFRPKKECFEPEFSKNIAAKVLWHLRGSHITKWYPHMTAAAKLLRAAGFETTFVGTLADCGLIDHLKISEEGFPIIFNPSFAKMVSQVENGRPLCVVGQETGFMAACSLMPVPKILLLSHTPRERFADWLNTACLTPVEPPPCQPCYLSHSDFTRCMMHVETKAALCQAMIAPEQIVEAVKLIAGTEQ